MIIEIVFFIIGFGLGYVLGEMLFAWLNNDI